MIEPNYDKILQSKIDYYGETKAAYEFAAYEYNKQYIELNKLSIQLVGQQRELVCGSKCDYGHRDEKGNDLYCCIKKTK